MIKRISKSYFNHHALLFKKINFEKISECSKIISDAGKKGGIVYTCGNGGSAYNASHYVTDWNKFIKKKIKQFKSISLCDNLGIITATSNDISYDNIFLEQLENQVKSKDILVCISGSGKSKNLIKAAKYFKRKKGKVIAIVGFDGGQLKKIANFTLHVPSYDMQLCEDIHMMIGHIIMKEICHDDIKR
ncbi:phosphoheptose isomerase [alpha proteobacterium HIMB114]|nr:phosphoheptose isomerase [alpha proteobacterium HIMB114]